MNKLVFFVCLFILLNIIYNIYIYHLINKENKRHGIKDK